MSTALPRPFLRIRYEEAAEAYLRSLPPEHFMEATEQATQRKITLESLDLLHSRRPDVQIFNELLVQYPAGRELAIRQVVPDNMVVICDRPIKASGSFDVVFQPVGPFWVLEYVSKHNKRKDYEKSFKKYEQWLKVPYYLVFYPDSEDLTLYHLKASKYRTVKPNDQGRYAIPELKLEVAILDGWVRLWLEGELLPLPADLQREVDQLKEQLAEGRRQALLEKHRADEQSHRADHEQQARLAAERQLADVQAQLEQLRTRGPALRLAAPLAVPHPAW